MIRARGWTDDQIEKLKDCYNRDDISLDELSLLISKSETSICVMAKKLNLKKKRIRKIIWTEDEIDFLKKAYSEFDTTLSEIALAIGKKEYTVKNKIKELGLVKLTENEHLFNLGKKRCSSCKEILPIEDFQNNKSKPDGLSSQCRPCCALNRKIVATNSNSKNNDSLNKSNLKRECIACHKIKSEDEFYNTNRRCKECRRLQMKERKLKDLMEKGYC